MGLLGESGIGPTRLRPLQIGTIHAYILVRDSQFISPTTFPAFIPKTLSGIPHLADCQVVESFCSIRGV